jgi:hypothetical protein
MKAGDALVGMKRSGSQLLRRQYSNRPRVGEDKLSLHTSADKTCLQVYGMLRCVNQESGRGRRLSVAAGCRRLQLEAETTHSDERQSLSASRVAWGFAMTNKARMMVVVSVQCDAGRLAIVKQVVESCYKTCSSTMYAITLKIPKLCGVRRGIIH